MTTETRQKAGAVTRKIFPVTLWIMVAVGVVLLLALLAWAFITSVKSAFDYYDNPLGLPRKAYGGWQWGNYKTAFEAISVERAGVRYGIFRLLANSMLFAVGGGMATVPFLKNIGLATGWYSQTDLMNMLAVSESTPGPIGINMATYVGFTVAGIPGAVIATIGEVTPSIIVILIVAAMLTKFRNSKYVENAFYGLRPASSGLIGAACAGVVLQVLLRVTSTAVPDSLFMRFSWDGTVSWMGLALAAVLLVLTNWVKLTKKWHPIVFIGLSAAVGVVFRFGGV